jgi:fatty acid desaturase
VRRSASWWQFLPCSLLIGHSLGVLGFLAHDVSHHSIKGPRPLPRVMETVLWGLNGTSPTMWKAVHNQTHHQETNTLGDPDRRFLRAERNVFTRIYHRLFFPSRHTVPGSPLPFFYAVPYIRRHLITSLLPGKAMLPIVTNKPDYTPQQRRSILIDLVFISALQVAAWRATGGRWVAYLWASPMALLAGSSLNMLYIFTNHFLNPLCDHTDPLVGSTSVIVPRWMNWLHDNFSYHTEHHIFPGMNPKWSPEVSRLLIEHFPDRYHRLPLAEAWRRLWKQGEFIDEP